MEDHREAAAAPAEEEEVDDEEIADDRDGGVPMDTGTDIAGTSAPPIIDLDDEEDTEPAPAAPPARSARRRTRRHRDTEAHRRIDDLTEQMIDSYAALTVDMHERFAAQHRQIDSWTHQMLEGQHYQRRMMEIQFQQTMGYPFDPTQFPYIPPPPPDRDY